MCGSLRKCLFIGFPNIVTYYWGYFICDLTAIKNTMQFMKFLLEEKRSYHLSRTALFVFCAIPLLFTKLSLGSPILSLAEIFSSREESHTMLDGMRPAEGSFTPLSLRNVSKCGPRGPKYNWHRGALSIVSIVFYCLATPRNCQRVSMSKYTLHALRICFGDVQSMPFTNKSFPTNPSGKCTSSNILTRL